MKEIIMRAGDRVEEAYVLMKRHKQATGEDCFVKFNNAVLYSYDSRSMCFIKVTGMNPRQYQRLFRMEIRKIKQRERAYRAMAPKMIKSLKARARGIIAEEYLQKWDDIVPVRVKDMYHGYELECALQLIEILNSDMPEEDRFEDCRALMNSQDHSGMSARLVFSCLMTFHALGEKCVSYLRSNP